jgi:serine/threonine-protein kinase
MAASKEWLVVRRILADPQEWQVLSKLLDEALDVAPDKRDLWLESLPSEAAAHAPELRSLLRHAGGTAESDDDMDGLPELQAVASAYAEACRTALAPGSSVGPYIVEKEIASGGMGTVWLARRGDGMIKRPVALKLPHTGPPGGRLAERFERERDILAGLAHPNIARLYDAGFSAEGQPYLALEYVPGTRITVYCDEHRLDIRQRLQLFQQVLRAVQYAHSNLVIHRDLKPSNVLVGHDGRAMLLDFGIAKLISPEGSDNGPRTQFGLPTLALTPEYASPEQISGQPITTASDIYSLGVLLFELLTGKHPYRLEHRTRAALEAAILSGNPDRPSQSGTTEEAASARASTVRALTKALHGDLDTIVLKALRTKPEDRYSTADALSEDIQRYLAAEPIAARKDSWYHTRKFIQRHRLPFAGAGVAFAVLIATAGVAMYEAHEASMHARVAAAERDRALTVAGRNAAAGEFLRLLITEAAKSDKPVSVAELVARSEAIANKEYQDNPENRAAVLEVLAGYYDSREEYSRNAQLLGQAIDLVKNSPDSDLRRELTCTYAMSLAKIGAEPKATSLLNSVVQDPLITEGQLAMCLSKMSRLAQLRGDGPTALKYARQAWQHLRQSSPHPPPQLEGDFLGDIAISEYTNGHNDIAADFFAQSLARMTRAGLDHSRNSIGIRNDWALSEKNAGNPRGALALIDETLHINAVEEPEAPPVPSLLHNRAAFLEELGRYREAHEEYLQCATQSLARAGGIRGTAANSFVGLASVAQELGDLVSAKNYVAAAEDDIRAPGSVGSAANFRLSVVRASLALKEGRLRESHDDLDPAIAVGKDAFWMTRALVVRAEMSLRENNLSAAEADARRALQVAQAAQGSGSYSNRTGVSWLMLGRVLQEQGKQAAAHDAFRAAVENLGNTVDPDHPQLVLARQLAQ